MGDDLGSCISARFHVSGGETYHGGETSPSFFRDLRHAQQGDFHAMDQLRRNNAENRLESRALGNTGGTGGSGGEFAPPAWLVDEFIKLARPGRVTADLFHRADLPDGGASVNLPRVLTGTTTAAQSTQNTALSQTDLTTAALSSGVVTIGGKQVVSQQLLDQSGTAFDRVILEDLAADYARQIGTQVLTGTGAVGQLRGFLAATSTNVQTWTQVTLPWSTFS
ncbi:phage major capsid protein [Dermatophilaceae bacterium Soc4.6]